MRHYLGTQGRDIRREQQLEVDLDHTLKLLYRGLFAVGNSPSQSVVRRERGVLLTEALAALPEDYREVVVLRHLENLSMNDVAARMNRSVESVKKLCARALAKLRVLLGNEWRRICAMSGDLPRTRGGL